MRLHGIILFTYCPVIIIINAFLISSIIATKQSLKNASNLILICLSASDILCGAICVPLFSIEHIWYEDQRICSMETTSAVLQSFFIGNSIGLTMLLAADRYMHMNPDFQTSPPRLLVLFKRPWIFGLIFTMILLSAAVAVDLHFSMMGGVKRMMEANLYASVMTFSTMTSIVSLYIRGYLRIRRHVAENPVYANRPDSSDESPGYLKQLFKTVLLLLIALTVSTLPLIITILTISIAYLTGSNSSPRVAAYFHVLSSFFLYTYAVTNAMIIFYRNKKSWDWLRKKVSRLFCCKQRSQDEEHGSTNVGRNIRTTCN